MLIYIARLIIRLTFFVFANHTYGIVSQYYFDFIYLLLTKLNIYDYSIFWFMLYLFINFLFAHFSIV